MLIYTNEIRTLKMLWEREIGHFKDVCKQKSEEIKKLNEIADEASKKSRELENEEFITEEYITSLQVAIEELQKMQKGLPLERLNEKSI